MLLVRVCAHGVDQHPTVDSLCSQIKNCVDAILDIGASDNYICEEDERCVLDAMKESGPTVALPNFRQIKSSKSEVIPLSPDAQKGHILPSLKSATLISTGKLCDDGCDVIYRKDKVHVIKNKEAVNKTVSASTSVLQDYHNPLINCGASLSIQITSKLPFPLQILTYLQLIGICTQHVLNLPPFQLHRQLTFLS